MSYPTGKPAAAALEPDHKLGRLDTLSVSQPQ